MRDVFICHASEDKDAVARPIAEALTQRGFSVWYDEYELKLGDKLRRSIDGGLSNSRYGVVVLSSAFFSKEWPQLELDGLAARESEGEKVILPIWHGVDQVYVARYSPTLADRVAVTTREGIGKVVDEIERVLRSPGGSKPVADKRASHSTTGRSAATLLLSKLARHELEDRAFLVFTEEREEVALRQLERELRAIGKGIFGNRPVDSLVGREDSEQLLRDGHRMLTDILRRFLPVWVSAIDAGALAAARRLGVAAHEMYERAGSRYQSAASPGWDPLQTQFETVAVAYALGGYAIAKDKAGLASVFLNRGSAFSASWRDRSWFRYVGTELARKGRIKKSLIPLVVDFWGHDEYALDVLGGEDGLTTTACQFDFLQCASVLAVQGKTQDCFPSFSVYHKIHVQPIIEKIISACLDGIWLPPMVPAACAALIAALDAFAANWSGFEHDWEIDNWSSPAVIRFLAENLPSDRGTQT